MRVSRRWAVLAASTLLGVVSLLSPALADEAAEVPVCEPSDTPGPFGELK